MGRGLGHIQKKILTVLDNIEERLIEKGSREKRWVWLKILIIKIYNPQRLEGDKRSWDWRHSKNQHRRIWESVRMLERRGLVECRIRRVKEMKVETKFGGTQTWMEVRKRTEEEIRGKEIEELKYKEAKEDEGI